LEKIDDPDRELPPLFENGSRPNSPLREGAPYVLARGRRKYRSSSDDERRSSLVSELDCVRPRRPGDSDLLRRLRTAARSYFRFLLLSLL